MQLLKTRDIAAVLYNLSRVAGDVCFVKELLSSCLAVKCAHKAA